MKTRLLHERLRQLLVVLLLALPLALSAKINHGDVNSDNEVNILDVDAVIKVILSGHNDMAADVNNDGEVNILDADKIINIILYGDEDDEFHELCVRASEIDHDIMQYCNQCESLEEMMQYADAIRAIDDVEYVSSNGTTTMFVKIKDFFTFMYSFYSEEFEETNNQALQRIKQIQDVISQNSTWAYGHNGLEGVKFLAVNQQTDRARSVRSAEDAMSMFKESGIEADVHPSPDVKFFRDGIFDCDYLFLITHGCYDVEADVHWMSTSVPVERDASNNIRASFLEQYEDYGTNEVAFEVRNVFLGESGPYVSNGDVQVSEHLINNSPKQFRHPGKAVVFNVACQSMKGPTRTDSVHTGLAEAFINRGACAYIGYDETNTGAQVAGLEFWNRLASGLTIEGAFNNISSILFHEYYETMHGHWSNFWADLMMHPKDTSFPICVAQPVVTYEDKSTDNMLQINLKATGLYTMHISAIDSLTWEMVEDNSALGQFGLYYGFELCEDDQFTDGVSVVDEKRCGEQGLGYPYLNYTCSLTYKQSDPDSKIKPGMTYWARAYMYDGDGFNYSEPISFTTPAMGSLTVSTTEVDFGNVPKGENPTQILEIINNSVSSQTVTVKVTSPFMISDGVIVVSSKTLEVPGNSCSPVTLLFPGLTASEGEHVGTATISSAAIEGGSMQISLHATVINTEPTDNEVIPVGDTGVSITMVPVEGGTFTMGATPEQGDEYESNEVPAHQVTVSSFSIAQTEVTQALWQAVMGSNPSEFKGNLNRPVENVSWNDCQTFITKLNQMTGRNFRLPTEAEWEFAARGGNKRVGDGFKYSGSNNVNLVAWYWGNIPSQASGTAGYGTQPVATKKANELGLYDMSGNVYEWVQDRYGSYDFDSQTNPTGPSYGSYRVARGGTWGSYDHFCRVSNRNNFGPSTKSPVVGLRLVL